MSCVLRTYGKDFDIDSYNIDNAFMVTNLYRKGDLRFPNSKHNSKVNEYSGLTIEVSTADFSDQQDQINDAIAFIKKHILALQTLSSYIGVENSELDFGFETKPPYWQSYSFPKELIELSSKAGLGLCVSTYPTDESNET